MRIYWNVLAIAAAVALANPALGQPKSIAANPTSDWQHTPTGKVFPPTLAGLDRTDVSEFQSDGLDVSANYGRLDGGEVLTFFLFRNVSGNTPVWFDRARTIITMLPDKYREPDSQGVRAFMPRGQQAASGLVESFAVSGKFRSTTVAVFPVNGFYAKVRASSATRDAAALEQWLLAAVDSINWSSRDTAVAARALQPCGAPMPPRDPAELAETNEEQRIMSALLAGAAAQVTEKQPKPLGEMCREPRPAAIAYGIYRPVGSDDRYMVAITDAGRALSVGADELANLVMKGRQRPTVAVTLLELHQSSTFAQFKTVPTPEQAIAHVEDSKPQSVSATWGSGKREIIIDPGE